MTAMLGPVLFVTIVVGCLLWGRRFRRIDRTICITITADTSRAVAAFEMVSAALANLPVPTHPQKEHKNG